MPTVWVHAEDAARGSLPARCARSGTRCITRYPEHPSTIPAALEWVTWSGLWPRALLLRRRDAGSTDPAPAVVLPLLPSRRRAVVGLRRARDVTAVLVLPALLGLVLGGGGVGTRIAAGVAVGALLVHLCAAVLGLAVTVGVRLDDTGRWVQLSRVHPTFVAHVERSTRRPDATPSLPEEVADARAAVRRAVSRGAGGDTAPAPSGGREPADP